MIDMIHKNPEKCSLFFRNNIIQIEILNEPLECGMEDLDSQHQKQIDIIMLL